MTTEQPAPVTLRDREAARYMGISRSSFRALVKSGRIPAPLKPSIGISLWKREWLDKFVNSLDKEGRK
jgi:predicted DNA-binding transcriptional regulator AlpA